MSDDPTTHYRLDQFRKTPSRSGRNDNVSQWLENEAVFEIEDNNVFVAEDVRKFLRTKEGLTDEEKIIIQRLSMKAFHLPGNTYWEDWMMFISNNHILASFCFAHPLHPFTRRQRVMNLVASLSFGIAATSMVMLWYYYEARDKDFTFVSIFGFNVSYGMLATAFFGGLCNVFFDFGIWFVQVCPLCQPGSPITFSDPTNFFFLWLGSNAAFFCTTIALCLAIHAIIVRASIEEDGDDQGVTISIQHYSFILSFLFEVVVTQFIMFPIVAFTIFSGVLGCFTLPGIGGRPYQVKKMEKRMQRLTPTQAAC